MATSAAKLDWLLGISSSDTGIDRKALASLLVELARSIEPQIGAQPAGVRPIDPRLEQLRTLLVGRELDVLARLSALVEDPEQLATAVGRVLPTAIAQTSDDARLGQVLAPALEKATQSSIRSDPRTLVNILYPLIVPAIRKSISETIDETFQSLNEALKHSLTWHGLKWRWEAWRTGTPFAKVVLKHTLIFQVEHAFLIHRHTGLLIAHVAAQNASSQDPQVVSSMLAAIQDFVRDSFGGAGHQGLDSVRLGELTLWSEPGPFATLVAVIWGSPPEGLHETLRNVLSRIHADRPQALEAFDGNSSGFADVEAELSECVALKQGAAATTAGFPWVLAAAASLLLILGAGWGFLAWHSRALWEGYIAQLRTQPGIVITSTGHRDGKFFVAGLRDPLAADPLLMLQQTKLDRSGVVSRWEPYESLAPDFVLKRLRISLNPPPTVTLSVSGDHIVARGAAPFTWLLHARAAERLLPTGAASLDLSAVRDFPDGPLGMLRAAIQSHAIHFDRNESLPAAGQDGILDELAKELMELQTLSSTMGVNTRTTLIGHSDATGQGTFNLSLSLARAEAVLTLLKKRGVDPDVLAARATGPLEPQQAETSDAARAINRRVSFTVAIE